MTSRPPEASPDLAAIVSWLSDGARSAATAPDVLTDLCERLTGVGIPLWRVAVYVHTLHPQVMARQFLWRPGGPAKVAEAPYSFARDETFRASPITRIRRTGETIRRRLAEPQADEAAIFIELRADGATDYLAAPLAFTDGENHAASFTTRRPGGFRDDEIATLLALVPALARVAEARALRRTAVNLLDAYVGHDAGERILAGRIQRGDVEPIRAAIWLSDMRGFTKLVDSVPPETVIARLNLFYDALVPAIEGEGGEVLKFIGDGLLAIFRFDAEAEIGAACARALSAARRARAAVGRQAADDLDAGVVPMRFGVALHVGEALYGNIGGGSRLDFTCIGRSINMAARIEKIAAQRGRVVVASGAFADRSRQDFVALGDFELAGFREPQTLFGLADEDDEARADVARIQL